MPLQPAAPTPLPRTAPEALVQGAERAVLGEGPIWDDGSGLLRWIDITPGRIHRWSPATGSGEALEPGPPVGALALRVGGGLLAAGREGIALLDAAGRLERSVPTAALLPRHRFNDGACDDAGRFWTGSTALEFGAEPGALCRLDADGGFRIVREGIAFPNGLGFSPDGGLLYLVDSLARQLLVAAIDVDSGALGRLRPLIGFEERDGLADGLAVDAEGCLWVARYGGGAIERYDSAGRRLLRWMLPLRQPTSLAFGGPRLRSLWVTSARQHLDPPGPLDGALLRLEPGVAGLPSRRFAG